MFNLFRIVLRNKKERKKLKLKLKEEQIIYQGKDRDFWKNNLKNKGKIRKEKMIKLVLKF